jgi:hypothetical protein
LFLFRAKQRNEEFATEYAKVLNRFTEQFIAEFCHKDGAIDWDKLLAFNSGRAKEHRERRESHEKAQHFD